MTSQARPEDPDERSAAERNQPTCPPLRPGSDDRLLFPECLNVIAQKGTTSLCLYQGRDESAGEVPATALVFIVKEPDNSLKISRLDVRLGMKVAEIVALFNRFPTEHFEACFDQLGATTVEQSANSNSEATPEGSIGSDCYPTNCDLKWEHKRLGGSVVKLLQERVTEDMVIVLAASCDIDPEEYVIRIPQDKWSDHVGSLVRALSSAEDSAIRDTMRELAPFARDDSVLYSDGRRPTAMIIDDLIHDFSFNFESNLLIEPRSDRTPYEAAERILERRQSVMVRFRQDPASLSMWKKMFVTSTEEGVGFVVLCLGRKGARSETQDPQVSPTHGRVQYDFDLSDLVESQRREWLRRLLNAFADSQEEFPGPITAFLSNGGHERKLDGNERVRLANVTGLKEQHLNPNTSVRDFQQAISGALRCFSLEVNMNNESISCSNSKGDRLLMTVKPTGIESIVVEPRKSTSGGVWLGARFLLDGIYQFGSNFTQFIAQVGSLLASEGSPTQPFLDRTGRQTGPIGASLVLNFLNGVCVPSTSRAKHGSLLPNFEAVPTEEG